MISNVVSKLIANDIDFDRTNDTMSFHLHQGHPKMVHLRWIQKVKWKDIERERPWKFSERQNHIVYRVAKLNGVGAVDPYYTW